MSKDESTRRIAVAQERLTRMRLLSAGLLDVDVVAPGLVVLFEGFDAAGKGGAIQRLTARLDPRLVRVVPIGPPSDEERRHHFLWRFQRLTPGRGEMTVFDRSWYGRLLVEVVEELIDAETAERSTKEVVEYERTLLGDDVTIVKFWLHVSSAEQLRRFEAREHDPLKRWKLTADDWRNREKRDAYSAALTNVVAHTSHDHAPWNLVSGEDKHYARAAVLETLVERWHHDLHRRGLEVDQW